MDRDYPAFRLELQQYAAKLAKELRGPISAFFQLNSSATAPGIIDPKTKQLIALAIGITSHCEGCIAYHVYDALHAGASREEILEVLGVAVLMGGGPSLVYACEALKALEQFTAKDV